MDKSWDNLIELFKYFCQCFFLVYAKINVPSVQCTSFGFLFKTPVSKFLGEVRRTVGDEQIGRAVQERETTTRAPVCRFWCCWEKKKKDTKCKCLPWLSVLTYSEEEGLEAQQGARYSWFYPNVMAEIWHLEKVILVISCGCIIM